MSYQSLLLVKHKIHCAENEKQQLFYYLFFPFGPCGEFLLDSQCKAWDRQSDINERPPCVKFDIFSQSFVTKFFVTSTESVKAHWPFHYAHLGTMTLDPLLLSELLSLQRRFNHAWKYYSEINLPFHIIPQVLSWTEILWFEYNELSVMYKKVVRALEHSVLSCWKKTNHILWGGQLLLRAQSLPIKYPSHHYTTSNSPFTNFWNSEQPIWLQQPRHVQSYISSFFLMLSLSFNRFFWLCLHGMLLVD